MNLRTSAALALAIFAPTGLAQAQTTWSSTTLPGAPLPSDLWITSNTSGTNQFDLSLGAGGSIARIRASRESNKELIPFGGNLTAYNTQWSLTAGTALDDGNAATDDRFQLWQAGTSSQRLAPVMQVEKNAATQMVDVYAVAQDQWSTHLQTAVQSKVSHLVRYEPLSDGSVKVRRVIRFGDATVNGTPLDITAPYFENQHSFHVANFNALAEKLKTNGSPETYYYQGTNIPQNPQTDVTLTNGYAVVYNKDDTVNRAALGVVFGKTQMASPSQMIVNYSDTTTAISVRPGIRLFNAAPGSILDVTYYLVPSHGLTSALTTRLNNLVAATPAPVVYPAGTTFTGELATIVQRLNNNLALPGIRTDRLGYDVTPAPVASRPMLLNGPEDDADIRARLAVFPQNPESLLKNYLYGTAAEKQSATNYFFRYPGSGDGNGLRSTYVGEMGRALMWDMYRYDIAVGLGYATEAQKQKAKDLAVEYITANFPYLGVEKGGGGNLYLETYLAMGLAGLNFPEHPDSQLWVSRSVTYVAKFLDTYFPDGGGNESPRYHDWSLELVGKFLRVMQRRVNVDLYDHQAVRSALEWFIRFSSPPVSLTSNKMVTPAWGDSTYSSNGGSHYYYDLSIFAPYFKDRDPDFSARLQDWWVRNGKPRQVYNAGAGGLTNILLLDPRLPTVPQRPNTSTYSARYGMATLRAGTGTNDELFASFKCGANGGVHSDADMGHIDLFAFGVPLALDSTSGPYITGFTYNEMVPAHNTVRFNGGSASDTASGEFQAFGTSATADYAVGKTNYGTTSVRHMVMMKGDYLVVWDETAASNYADWFFHVPGLATLEWQPHKVVSHTPWGVDLDVHFVLPSATLPAPTLAGTNFVPSDASAITNPLASAASDPGIAGMFTTQGDSRFGAPDASRNPFSFQTLKYFSVRNSPSGSDDFLTVLHPRKVGVTPELTTELLSSSASGATVRVTYNGRVDTIAFTSTGATVTKGSEPSLQFAKTWPQSGVSGATAFVKANFLNTPVTPLTNSLATNGPVEVHTGELALGANNRIPDNAPLMVKPGGTFNTATFNETVGKLIMDGGVLKGAGALTASSIDWWGGILEAPVTASGNFVKKGGTDWSRPTNLNYSGDTVIESGNLAFQPGGPALPGTGRVVLANGTGLKLNGAAASISNLDVTGSATLSGGTLAVTQSLTGTGTLTNTGALDLSGVTTISPTVSISTTGTLTLPAGAWSVKRLIINGVIQRVGTIVTATTHPGLVAGAGTITALEDIPVPTGLSAAVSLGKITLTWSPIDGATSYSVRRALVSGGPYTEIGTPAAATFDDTNVTDGVTYFYVVATRDAYGDSANSAEVSATASGPWYFDPNGTTAGSVANGGSYTWLSNSWTKTPGGEAAVEAWSGGRHAHFAASNPGTPLAYAVSLAGFNGASHDFKSLRVANGTVTFTGAPSNFYFKQAATITADAGVQIRFSQTGTWAFNLNLKTVTFDGAGTTIIGEATPIVNTGNITKTGSGTLVITSPSTYSGTTSINGGTLRLAVTDLPSMWLDATRTASLIESAGALSQWTDANAKGTYVSQASASNRPTLVTDNALAGPAKSLVDFGAFVFNATTTGWMQFNSSMTDIRALFWVGKTTNENFLLGSTATDYQFHSGGAGLPIWNTTYASANIRNGTTWLNGAVVPGTTTNMPPATDLVRIGAFTTANVSASAIGRDRTYRSGGIKAGEVMVFNTTLTTQQQTDIDAYLAKKWFNTGTGIGNRLPASAMVSLSNGGTLDLTGINFQTIAGLDANDDSATRVDLGAAELTISGSGSSSFDGVISGTGGLRKAGAGTFTLGGANTYTGPTLVEAGTLVTENAITSNVTVKSGATLVNNGTITGDVIMESGATYLGDGSISGTITTSPPVVTITSPTVDLIVLPDLATDLDLTASIVFNTAFGTPAVTWSMVSGPGTVTFEDPSSASTTARFSTAGTYTLRCSAVATVNGQVLQGFAQRVVRPGGPLADSSTATFREGDNGYTHAATFIRGDNSGTWNSGARDQFLIGRNSYGMRGLFAFDLSAIPAAATITSAAFDLWIAQAGTGTVNSFELRPLLKDFVEGTGNSSSSATVGAGTGADWNSRTGSTTTNLWDSPGGQAGTDFSNTVIGSLAGFDATTTAVGTKLGFTLDPSFVAEANAAVSAARPLRLVLAMSGDTSTGNNNKFARFASDDHAITTQRPQLTINYSTGNPAVPSVNPGTAPTAIRNVAAALAGSVGNAGSGVQWSIVSGPGDAIFSDATQPATTVTFSETGAYVLRLGAANAYGESSRTLTINVAANPGIFADWQTLTWPGVTDPETIAPDQDPDHDNISNLMEWALNLNATMPGTIPANLLKSGAVLEYTYTRRKTAPDEASFQVEWSDTLGANWSAVNVGGEILLSETDSTRTVKVTIPATADRRFVRLRVSRP